MSKKHTSRYAAAIALAGAALTPSVPALAAPFPPSAADELTTSLGVFSVKIAGPYQTEIQTAYSNNLLPPGFKYQGSNHTLYSSLLNDSGTQLGTSAPYNSSTPPGPVSIGQSSPVSVDPATLTSPFAAPAAGTEEVSTHIQSFDLSNGSGTDVKAGNAATAAAGNSNGQVQSKTSGTAGSTNNDFPARSFFDVFVEVDLPVTGLGTAVLNNTSPLLVENTNVTSFPPTVVYIHGNTSPVPLYFTTTNPGFWTAGDELGTISLAGHGAGYTNAQGTVGGKNDATAFERDFQKAEFANGTPLTSTDLQGFGMPLLAPEPGSLALIGVGLTGLGVLRRRRSRRE